MHEQNEKFEKETEFIKEKNCRAEKTITELKNLIA